MTFPQRQLTPILFPFPGCFWQVVLILGFLGASMCSVIAMTLHKYLSILHRIQLTQPRVLLLIAISWTGPALLIVGFCLISDVGSMINLQSSRTWCFVAMASENTQNMAAAILMFCFPFATICALIFGHYRILVAYRKWSLSRNKSKDVVVDTEQATKEQRLIKKSVAISGLFSFTWAFMLVKMGYEFSTHKQINVVMDNLVEFMGLASPIINTFVLYTYDAKFKANIRELFHLDSWMYIRHARISRDISVHNDNADAKKNNILVMNMFAAGASKETSTIPSPDREMRVSDRDTVEIKDRH